MDKNTYYKKISSTNHTDYEKYLNLQTLFAAQTKFNDLGNHDELQFQIVHQIEELWMKLILYSLVDVMHHIINNNTNRIITLMKRVHKIQELMINQMELLHTMSPREYQDIRLLLGNGSGQESPGFKSLLSAAKDIWPLFKTHYLDRKELTLSMIYNESYKHCDSYVVAETLLDFDRLFSRFLMLHYELIQRTIGQRAKSLKGRIVNILIERINKKFFPQLWDVRSEMTNHWGTTYGQKRPSISH